MDEVDRLAAHIGFREFGESLQAAANAVFPNDSQCRYKKVHALILCWEDEDPSLPVSIEIEKLFSVFEDVYHFESEVWKIPDEDCHSEVNEKILEFNKKGGKRKDHLKIVYYAGHAKLTSNRLLAWTRYVSLHVFVSNISSSLQVAGATTKALGAPQSSGAVFRMCLKNQRAMR
jgi:hypothetical protein